MSASVLFSQTLKPGCEARFRQWEHKISAAAGAFEGFRGMELTASVVDVQAEWVATLHFDTLEHLHAWMRSEVRLQLREEAAPLFASPSGELVVTSDGQQTVSAVVATRVAPDQVEAFRRWQSQMHLAQSRFEGFLGSELFPPTEGGEMWTALVRFDSSAHLDAWLASDQRKKLIESANEDFQQYHLRRVGGSFAGWFKSSPKPIPNWKQMLSILSVLYPTVVLLDQIFTPWLLAHHLNVGVRLIFLNILSMTLLTWGLMPIVNRVLGFWLMPSEHAPRYQGLMIGLLIVLYLVVLVVLFTPLR